TTVGESFADYVNETLGFGLTNTTVLFAVAFVIALAVQFRLRRYVPAVYWLTVVLISVVGTLVTDNLTDGHNVPLWISSAVFSVALVVVFGIWYARERTLSIHSIVTTPREAFYWLAVLVTFALGTAVGDWTLELTGWSPGVSVLLPLGLIIAVFAAWKAGAGPVLTVWIAYILTRPLGATLGDFLGSDKSEGGLGLGTLGTSLLFLGTILAVVVYLSFTHKDRTEEVHHEDPTDEPVPQQY
ncbi:MAG: COG4705 family protein, partial [Nocardioidaceae bacterium]